MRLFFLAQVRTDVRKKVTILILEWPGSVHHANVSPHARIQIAMEKLMVLIYLT